MTKQCPDCMLTKEITEFHKNKNTFDGLQVYCKACMKVRRNGGVIPHDDCAGCGVSTQRKYLDRGLCEVCQEASGEKRCGACAEYKPLDAFPTQTRGKFGRSSQCKACQLVAQKARAGTRTVTEKPCTQCHAVLPAKEFNKNRHATDGLQPCCRACQRVNACKLGPGFSTGKKNARHRGIPWSLTLEQYESLFHKNECAYCSADLSKWTGSCLDRKDNTKGYTLDNVQPCCGDCNKSRGVLTYGEWLAVVHYRRMNPKGQNSSQCLS